MADSIPVAGDGKALARLPLRLANRHGLIAGATGTGKTVTLRVLAENFSAAGVPVFLADIKGDLGGLCLPGAEDERMAARAREIGLPSWAPAGQNLAFWDALGRQGHPIRATVSDLGPLLLGRLLELNDVQAAVLELAFALADQNGWWLLDLKDLRALLAHIADNAKDLAKSHGAVSAASVAAIQRGLLALERQGGDLFFGEPALDLEDLMRTDLQGRGAINLLAVDGLMASPRLYATLLLWLLSELFERLPEVGDLERPKLVFFFDEAHLLFDGTPKALLDKIEQVVRLIRSKGIGVYFVSQSPLDLPDAVLGQLSHRVQHALRAFTPRDQKAVRAAAETMRASPGLDLAEAIGQLAVGEALVSLLDDKGVPVPAARMKVAPPRSRLGALDPAIRAKAMAADGLGAKYDRAVDRESAHEMLTRRAAAAPAAASVPASGPAGRAEPAPRGRKPDSLAEVVLKSAARSIGSAIGREILRGVLGSVLGRRR
ncbi:MAG: DUF853 family protein [Alphaproteobacteria bacterium]|nr:DUF853 family protein [Alphaproteobacteria bacterium]